MRTVLVTAFEPFGQDMENAADLICRKLPDRLDIGEGQEYSIKKRLLPTEFTAGAKALLQAMDQLRPELVICLGQAGGRVNITPERVAVNLMDGAMPDNSGFLADEEPVIPGGPAAYFTNVPVKAVVQAARENGYPVVLSNSAGTYVCNTVFYQLMHRIAYTPSNEVMLPLWGDFIHVPYVTEQQRVAEGMPALPVKQAAETVAYLMEEMLRRREGLRL